jgi:hypothetical protein
MSELQKRFKRIKKMKISSLAEMMSVHEQTLINIITLKGDELEEQGLDLEIDGDYIVKK